MRRARSAFLVLAGSAALAASPAIASAAKLSKPEKKAVDIAAVSGDATKSSVLVEVGFKGDLASAIGTGGLKKATVTYELSSAGAPATVITDRGPTGHSRATRTGTAGSFELIRNGRTVLLLVEDLPGPTEKVVVTTAGPAKAGSRAVGRASPKTFEELIQDLGQLHSADQIEGARHEAKKVLRKARTKGEKLDEDVDKTIDKLHKAKQALTGAENGQEATRAREQIDELKEDLAGLQEEQRANRITINAYERWLDLLDDLRPVQCSDFVDNDGDGKIDHPADPGCIGPGDNDEKNEDAPVACPADGASTQTSFTINTPATNTIAALAVNRSLDNQTLLSEPVTAPGGGPAQFPGEICGNGINVVYEYVVYDQSNAPPSFPPPPSGDFAITIFIDATNPFGGSNPGGTSPGLRFAIDTRGPQ